MDIKELADKEGAKFIQRCPDWNNRKIWQLLFQDPDEEKQIIGLPCLAEVQSGKARLLDDDEINEYLESVSKEDDSEEEEPIEV